MPPAYAALRSFASPTETTVREGAMSQPTTRTAKDANARNSIPTSLDLVRGLAVLRRVEPEHFLVLAHAQPYEEVDELEDHERHHG